MKMKIKNIGDVFEIVLMQLQQSNEISVFPNWKD